MTDDPVAPIVRSIGYARRAYTQQVPYGWPGPVSDEAVEEVRARAAAQRPRLADALDHYNALAAHPGLVGRIAALHAMDEDGECSQCGEGDLPCEWPCLTAETIAEGYAIDLTDFWLYRVRTQP